MKMKNGREIIMSLVLSKQAYRAEIIDRQDLKVRDQLSKIYINNYNFLTTSIYDVKNLQRLKTADSYRTYLQATT